MLPVFFSNAASFVLAFFAWSLSGYFSISLFKVCLAEAVSRLDSKTSAHSRYASRAADDEKELRKVL